VIVMLQEGQVFRLRGGGGDEKTLWAFRYRGGFASERDASEALERSLERVRR
jgi:integrase